MEEFEGRVQVRLLQESQEIVRLKQELKEFEACCVDGSVSELKLCVGCERYVKPDDTVTSYTCVEHKDDDDEIECDKFYFCGKKGTCIPSLCRYCHVYHCSDLEPSSVCTWCKRSYCLRNSWFSKSMDGRHGDTVCSDECVDAIEQSEIEIRKRAREEEVVKRLTEKRHNSSTVDCVICKEEFCPLFLRILPYWCLNCDRICCKKCGGIFECKTCGMWECINCVGKHVCRERPAKKGKRCFSWEDRYNK